MTFFPEKNYRILNPKICPINILGLSGILILKYLYPVSLKNEYIKSYVAYYPYQISSMETVKILNKICTKNYGCPLSL